MESRDDAISIYGLAKVGEGQATKSALLVEMVVECIRRWDR
jgi:hypothetical protein